MSVTDHQSQTSITDHVTDVTYTVTYSC